MLKKLIFTLVILIAVIVVSMKLEQEKELKSKTAEHAEILLASDILNRLAGENYTSIVILAENDTLSVREADKLIAALNSGQKIKVLAFEIYTQDTSPERLTEIAYANGEPDIFYISGRLVEPKAFAAFIRNELETLRNK